MARTIQIDELTRVEGHGSVEVVMENNVVQSVKLNIYEGPRFIESLIKTMYYDKVPDITRRICAICTASHSLASIGAIENAFNVQNSTQTNLLKDLLIHGETIESHALHIFMLALPDFLGFPDAISMASEHLDAVKAALEIKKAGNLVHNILSGREIHGMNERVGGFSKIPSESELINIKTHMENVLPIAELAVKILGDIELPQFSSSNNQLLAINPGNKYGFLGNYIKTSYNEEYHVEEYLNLTSEKTIKHSHAKFSTYKDLPFMVGSLPRIILNKDKLEGKAKELTKIHNDKLDPLNSLCNNLSQALELVHSVERCIVDIDALLSNGLKNEGLVEFDAYKSRGINVVEAPRGLLYHDYSFDDDGCVTKANIITPTAQNAANIEKDIKVTVDNLKNESDEKIKESIELVVRAYDPCISCSVHLVHVK